MLWSGAAEIPAVLPNQRRCAVGDKSPKDKERKQKQGSAQKDQQKAAAAKKAAKPVPGKPLKGGR